MYKVTIFRNIRETSTPFHKEIAVIFDRIRSGNSKELVNKVRSAPDKKLADEFKSGLPSICFSGIFKKRSKSGIIEHSGLICLDFDKYKSEELLLTDRKKLIADPYTYALFTSPSGKGLKVLVKIPKDIENHSEYFDALEKYYNNPNFDTGVSDVSRVCYESYDPDLFINENSLLWDKKEEEKILSYDSGKHTAVKLTNENEVIKRLFKWFERTQGMKNGSRNTNLFKLASAFSDFGISETEAKRFCLQFEESDFDANEIEGLVKQAYKRGSANFGMKYFEDEHKTNDIKAYLRSGKSVDEVKKKFENVDEEAIEHICETSNSDTFWTYTKGDVQINHLEYKNWLQTNGFYKFYPEGSESYVFVRVENNLIDNTTEVRIKDFVLNEILKRGESKVYQYLAGNSKFFKDEYLNILDPVKLSFKEDTIDECFMYFRNGAVKIRANDVEMIDYLDLDGFVWKKHIIDFDIQATDTLQCDFERFIWLISAKDECRYNSVVSTLGYMMHSFKTSANNKAVILNDETISENPNGGSGKGIFWNALSKVKRVCDIDGKSFSFDKSFPYQTVSADTQILVFDDVQKNFKFEKLFSIITEGITLEKKNKDAIKIPVKRSPKVLITTNYTLGGVGGSHERRKWELEFSAHFSSKHTPLNEFGRMLFDEWDSYEWLRFYNFMIRAVQYYLMHGLIEHEFNNLHTRKFIKETSFEFYEWIKDNPVNLNERLDKNTLFMKFLEEYPDWKTYKLSQKRFWIWFEKWASFTGYIMSKGQDSMGNRYVEFLNKE